MLKTRVTLADEDGSPKTYADIELRDDNSTIVVKNVSGVPLPNTGGVGTNFIYLVGVVLITLAGTVLMLMRKIA